jgi:cellobiose-specific phosphotransferase system component IIC
MSISSAAWRPSSAAFSILRRLGDQPFILAARDALPWSFGGLIAAFLVIFPFTHHIGPLLGPSLGVTMASALLPAFGVMSAVLVCTLAWRYATLAGSTAWMAVTACAVAYAIALPAVHGLDVLQYLRQIGPSGLLLAFAVCGIFAIASFRKAGWPGRHRDLIAAAAVVIVCLALREANVSLSSLVIQVLAPLSHLGDTYGALLVLVLVQTLLWAFGLHGSALLGAVVAPVYLTLQMQNTQAYAHHELLPHVVVVSLFLFVFPGGAGGTLPLALLLLRSRVPRLRTIARVTVVPAIFNTNEPLLFGLPVVLNPFLIPPFIITPLVLATMTYLAVVLGWVARAAFYVPSSVPSLISGYAATLDPRAVGLAAINLAVAAAIYWPFVRAYERHLEKQSS